MVIRKIRQLGTRKINSLNSQLVKNNSQTLKIQFTTRNFISNSQNKFATRKKELVTCKLINRNSQLVTHNLHLLSNKITKEACARLKVHFCHNSL